MGCTSSATNMPEPPASTTDVNVDNNISPEDSEEQIKDHNLVYSNSREFKQKQDNPQHEIKMNQRKLFIDDNTESKADFSELELKDNQDTSLAENLEINVETTEPPELEKNFVSLKGVVEKLISENAVEGLQINDKPLVVENENVELDRQIEEIVIESNDGGVAEEIEYNEDEAKESTSPTQSEDSRATRWEALADIAAELPPSLAVDPLTGQIYSLAK